jgi:hypothetical protein
MGCEEVECYPGMPVESGALPTTAQTNLTNTDRKSKCTSFTAHLFLVITPASDGSRHYHKGEDCLYPSTAGIASYERLRQQLAASTILAYSCPTSTEVSC